MMFRSTLLALLAVILLATTGCDPHERGLSAARSAGTSAAYREYLASEPPEPFKADARNELAAMEFRDLGPSPTSTRLAALLREFGDTTSAREIARAYGRADYSEKVLPKRTDPAAMAEAARAWEELHAAASPDFLPKLRKSVNDAIFDRLRRSDASANLYATLLGAVMEPADEEDLIEQLVVLGSNIRPNARMISATVEFGANSLSPTGRSVWIQQMARVLGDGIPRNAPASLMRVYLKTIRQEWSPEAWETVRQRYDDTVAGDIIADPTRTAMDGYLADEYTQRRREEWQRQLAAFDAAMASPDETALAEFVRSNPSHLLMQDARKVLAARNQIGEYREVRDKLAAALGNPRDDYSTVELDPERRPITADTFTRTVLPIEFDQRIVCGLTLLETGLVLIYDEQLAAATNPEGTARLQGRDPYRVYRVARDTKSNLCLFQFDMSGRSARGFFQPARLAHSRSVRQADEVSAVGTAGRSPALHWSEGKITSGESEMYREGLPQLMKVSLVKQTLYDTGFLFGERGDAIGIITARRGGDEVSAVGLAEAAPFILQYFEGRMNELQGIGPDSPQLESMASGDATTREWRPSPGNLVPPSGE